MDAITSNEKAEEICVLYRSGLSICEIALKEGYGANAIESVLARKKLVNKPESRMTEMPPEWIREWLELNRRYGRGHR